MKQYITLKIPKNFMNIGITIHNNLVADTNDSSNWDTIVIPLPKLMFKKWKILRISNGEVDLIAK